MDTSDWAIVGTVIGVGVALLAVIVPLVVTLIGWVRQDVGNAEERVGARIDGVEEKLGKRIDGVEEKLGKRIDQVEERLGKRIDTLATDEAALARSVAWMQGAVGVRPGERVVFGQPGGERAEPTPEEEVLTGGARPPGKEEG